MSEHQPVYLVPPSFHCKRLVQDFRQPDVRQRFKFDNRAWIQTWNDNPRPYVWTKTADEILASVAAYCSRIKDSGL